MNDTQIINQYLPIIDKGNSFFIDIGCSYEFNIPEEEILRSSQTIFFECDASKISRYEKWKNHSNFKLITERVTPGNVVQLIKSVHDNRLPKLLDIDIDGYDWFVLEKILDFFRPSIIVAEINEKIPPPIKFSVKYSKDYSWDASHYYGMSLAKADELFQKHQYQIINLSYNNVFAVAKEHNPNIPIFSAEQAYEKFYKKANWEKYFSYNKDVENWLRLNTEQAIVEIDKYFKKYHGNYVLYA